MSQTDDKLPVWGFFRIPNQQKPRQTRPGDGSLSAVELLAFFSSLWSSFFLMIIWYFCAKSLVQAHVMTVMLPAACLAGWLSNQDWKPSIQLWLKKSTLRHTTGNIKIMMSWDHEIWSPGVCHDCSCRWRPSLEKPDNDHTRVPKAKHNPFWSNFIWQWSPWNVEVKHIWSIINLPSRPWPAQWSKSEPEYYSLNSLNASVTRSKLAMNHALVPKKLTWF